MTALPFIAAAILALTFDHNGTCLLMLVGAAAALYIEARRAP